MIEDVPCAGSRRNHTVLNLGDADYFHITPNIWRDKSGNSLAAKIRSAPMPQPDCIEQR